MSTSLESKGYLLATQVHEALDRATYHSGDRLFSREDAKTISDTAYEIVDKHREFHEAHDSGALVRLLTDCAVADAEDGGEPYDERADKLDGYAEEMDGQMADFMRRAADALRGMMPEPPTVRQEQAARAYGHDI